jgi:hypothetical protein
MLPSKDHMVVRYFRKSQRKRGHPGVVGVRHEGGVGPASVVLLHSMDLCLLGRKYRVRRSSTRQS